MNGKSANRVMQHPMSWGPVILCGWPGLASLWYRGRWTGLAGAIAFGFLLNLALISTFLWPGLLGPRFPWIVWPVTGLIWTFSAWWSARRIPDSLAVPLSGGSGEASGESLGTLFNQAQTEYLKGHWTETELLLTRQLERRPRDIESRLLLATMFRHLDRWEDAAEQLDLLQRFDESIRWRFEIEREREWLNASQSLAMREASSEEGDSQSGPTARAG